MRKLGKCLKSGLLKLGTGFTENCIFGILKEIMGVRKIKIEVA